MTAHDPNLPRGTWKRIFGFGTADQDQTAQEEEESVAVPEAVPENVRAQQRRRTLDDITRFLLAHALPVTPFTLEVAHGVITGGNPALARLVADRVSARERITLEWLEDALHAAEDDGSTRILDFVHHLESALLEFGKTSSAARTATSDYSSALTAHVNELGDLDGSADGLVELASLARGMLESTRAIERELSRSERETQALQKSLKEARRDAEVDHLTGLPNRRAFEAVLRREFDATRATGEPMCVAFCDIDKFKTINDTHGHEAGDRVLRVVAQSLATISNDKCHVARHGGEEFVALLRGYNVDEAWAVLDNAREMLAGRKLVNRATDMPFGRISFSAGVADAHAYADSRAALRAADEALLRAKEAGRNRVLRAGETGALPPN